MSEQRLLSALRSTGLSTGITQAELAARLNRRFSSLSSQLDRLESRGLIKRTLHPQDKRSKRVTLTPGGANLADASLALFRETSRQLLATLTIEDRRSLQALADDIRRPVPVRA